ncbi:hypothetical protein HYU13_01910 [Candidatus Woesearchaeota archaeon]|nr:hypothetical protein [Candidatus Woesearchaeota archaeon]
METRTVLATEPFSLNREKINIHRIDRFEDLGCTVGDYVKCDEFLVKKAASFCPNDFVIILVSRTKIADFLRPIRSSSVSNMAKINTADNPSVLLHEIGHAIGGLADEYVDEQYYRNAGLNIPSFPNCDVSSCSKWAGIEGTGCFSGCSLNEFYRPTDNSIMRSLQVKRFGPRNEDILIKRLKKYSGAP